MKSLLHGIATSKAEVTNISSHGFWLLSHNKELFLSYEDFPWFKNQTVGTISNVEEQFPGHYYWPDIDIDLTADIIENPDKYPLKTKIKEE